jgi:hypothetical protein
MELGVQDTDANAFGDLWCLGTYHLRLWCVEGRLGQDGHEEKEVMPFTKRTVSR